MNRRHFLAVGTFAGVGLTGLAGLGSFATPVAAKTTGELDRRAEAKLRLSSQVGGMVPGDTVPAKMANMKKYGIEAVEPHGGVVANPAEFKKMADDAGLEVSAICWGSHDGDLCKEDTGRINVVRDALKKALEAAGILGAKGVIYVPAFATQTTLSNQEIRKRCLEFLPEMGAFAKEHNTSVILEPLCRMEAFFLRQVADGASICRDCGGVDSGVAVMGDFYHMDTEEASDMGAFICGGPYVKHVHLAGGTTEPRRTLPGQNSRTFVDGFRGLKYIGYQNFCSLECGCSGDPAVEFPKAIDFLRAQWEEA